MTATALAISPEKGNTGSIIISADALWISDAARERFNRLLGKRLPNVPQSRVLISATHTHTAPTQVCWFADESDEVGKGIITPEEYTVFFADALASVAVQAWRAREPGCVAWGYGQAVVGHSRRACYRDGSAVMYGPTNHPLFSHMEGHENHGVDLFFAFSRDRRLTGVIVNVPCPSQCTEGASFVSADFWHETREELRKRYGTGLFVLPQCGAAGGLSPHLLIDRRSEERMLRLKGVLPEKGGDFDMAQRREIAMRIASAVDDVLPAVKKDIRETAIFAHESKVIELPFRRMTPADESICQNMAALAEERVKDHISRKSDPLDQDLTSWQRRLKYYRQALDRNRMVVTGERQVFPAEIHAVRIGDMAFCSNRFELSQDFGERIKARSPMEQTFIVQLAGEGGYLASARQEEGGGYGAWYPSTLTGSSGGDVLVEESMALLISLVES